MPQMLDAPVLVLHGVLRAVRLARGEVGVLTWISGPALRACRASRGPEMTDEHTARAAGARPRDDTWARGQGCRWVAPR